MSTTMLTAKDFSILEIMLERCLGQADPLRPILQDKLSAATVVFQDEIPASIVTLNSRARYRVDARPAETRIVSQGEMRGMVGALLPITHPRGLALLGLAEGQQYTLARNGESETISVLEVVYQPEAARREKMRLSGLRRPQLRLVHSADTPLAAAPAHIAPFGFDDPGPSAA